MTRAEVERLGAEMFKTPPACWPQILRCMVKSTYPWQETPVGESFVSDNSINQVRNACNHYRKRHAVRYAFTVEMVDGRHRTICTRLA